MIDHIIEGWSLNKICELAKSAEFRNALHACRPGHPWNKTAVRPWHNAWFVASGCPIFEVPSAALDWLRRRADEEAKNV